MNGLIEQERDAAVGEEKDGGCAEGDDECRKRPRTAVEIPPV